MTDTEVPPPAGDSPISAAIYRRLLAFTAGWPGERVAPNTLLRGLNTRSRGQPLFFCVQGFRELSQLARHLGEDQPVYGMRSGHGAMQNTPENVAAVADHYVREIVRAHPAGPCMLGGNCQGGEIAFAVAHRLRALGREVTLLCLLDSYGPQPYAGRVALFFSRWSANNPYRYYRWPELGWSKLTTLGFTIDFVPGTYGESFDEPNIVTFAAELRRAFALAQGPSWDLAAGAPAAADTADRVHRSLHTTDPAARQLPPNAYRARITLAGTAADVLLAHGGQALQLDVTVANESAVNWPKTAASGITLANRWLDAGGQVMQWLDARVELTDDLPPGAAKAATVVVHAPQTAGAYWLEFDVVEEGITWFVDRGSKTTRLRVQVSDASTPAPRSSGTAAADWLSAGRAAAARGDAESAIACLHGALEAGVDAPAPVHAELGEALLRAGRAREAVAQFERSLMAGGDSASANLRLGSAWLRVGDTACAIAAFESGLAALPSLPLPALREFAGALEEAGAYARARVLYERALMEAPHEPALWSAYARCLSKLGHTAQALTACRQGLLREPDNPHLLFLQADVLRASGDRVAAQQSYQRARAAGIENAWPLLRIGDMLREDGRVEDAIDVYRQAAGVEPTNAHAFFRLGQTYAAASMLGDAVASYQTGVRLDASHAWAFRDLGEVCARMDDFEAALTAYHSAAELDSEPSGVWSAMATCYDRLGQTDLARSYRKRAGPGSVQPAPNTEAAPAARFAHTLATLAPRRWSAIAGLLVLLAFGWRGLGSFFWQDDFFWLGLDPGTGWRGFLELAFAPKANGNLRPWSENLFFYGMQSLFGLDPLPFRIVVLVALGCTLWLLDGLVRRLTGSAVASILTQLCWLANPCMAVVLTWTSSFCQVLYLFFVVAALRLFIAGRPRAQLVMFVAGLGALEHVMVYPAIALLYAWLWDRSKLRHTWPLFAIAAAYLALHVAIAPPPASGPHAPEFDARIANTLWSYTELALGPQQLMHFAWNWPRWLVPAGSVVMLGLLLACAFAARRTGVFGVGLFVLLLLPVLPLPNHVEQYLLTGPVLGIALILGTAAVKGRRRTAAAAITVYLACCVPSAWQSMTWHLQRSWMARDLVTGVVAYARAHPQQTLLLTGMNTDQFLVGYADRPFAPFAVRDVYLAPGAERAIADPWGAAPAFVLPPATAWQLLDAGRASVLDVSGGHVRDATADYRAQRAGTAGR